MSQDIIDLPEVLERVQNDRELLSELIDIFLADCPVKISAIKQAIQNKDFAQLRDTAHSIKGASGNISAKKLHALFLQIEQAGKDNALAGTEALLNELDRQFQEFKEYAVKLKQELKKG